MNLAPAALPRWSLLLGACLLCLLLLLPPPVWGQDNPDEDDDKVQYSEGCDAIEHQKLVAEVTKCPAGQDHTWSDEFFEECRKKLSQYDIAIRPSPFDPEEACIKFPDLDPPNLPDGVEACFDASKYKSGISAGIYILILLIIFDLVGIGLMIWGCIRAKQHAPVVIVAPSTTTAPPPAPTVVIVQSVPAMPPAAPAADAPAPADT